VKKSRSIHKLQMQNVQAVTDTSSAYDPPNLTKEDLDEIRLNLKYRLDEIDQTGDDVSKLSLMEQLQQADLETLRVHSIKKNYSLGLLEQFYNQQMIPHFPLEDELDPLEDWILCLDPVQLQNCDEVIDRGPVMDVLILMCDVNVHSNSDAKAKSLILGGVAFEYYQEARVGLVSYVTINDAFQRIGLMKKLHPLAIESLHNLHSSTSKQRNGCLSNRPIRAILAETNSVIAGDGSVEDIRQRHICLYKLGYRMMHFPYVQPPLGTDQVSFDNVMLLVYQGRYTDNSEVWFPRYEVPTCILVDYVRDFFKSVYGYGPNMAEEISKHWYYQLTCWFTEKHKTSKIQFDLPWDDITDHYRSKYQEESENSREHTDMREHVLTVAIIGAGAAGLAASIELAEISKQPLRIKIIEANNFVGGRIRTVLTEKDAKGQYVSPELSDSCQEFSPWPVPIGAEFIHGVDSVVNDIVEKNDILVEETFDFCSLGEYPSRNSFSIRNLTSSMSQKRRESSPVKIFGNGECWDLNNPESKRGMRKSNYGKLISKAKELWDQIYEIGECATENASKGLPDKSLSAFIEERMSGSDEIEIEAVKSIIDAVYAKTAGTTVGDYSVNEGGREESFWDYGESNWRSSKCFADIVNCYLHSIECINKTFEVGTGNTKIDIILSCPINSIRNCGEESNQHEVKLTSRCKRVITCNKAIVTVPLSILKANVIEFSGDFSLPPNKRLAIDRINMFSGMKAHLLLRKGIDINPSPFLENTELFFCPGEIYSQVWLRRDESSVFLTGFVIADD